MPKIFISYRRVDSQTFTDRIYDRLAAEFGENNVFQDVDSIRAGADFRVVLKDEVESCDVVLVMIGSQWAKVTDAQGQKRLFNPADFVRIEVESALNSQKVVIPVLIEGAAMPNPDELPPSLHELLYRNAAKIRHNPDFNRDILRLIEQIQLHESDLAQQRIKEEAERRHRAEIDAKPKVVKRKKQAKPGTKIKTEAEETEHQRQAKTKIEIEQRDNAYNSLRLMASQPNPTGIWKALQKFWVTFPNYDPDNLARFQIPDWLERLVEDTEPHVTNVTKPKGNDVPNFDTMTPEEIMRWMETLAKRQGAATNTLTTKADLDIAEIDPNSVIIDEPGYIPSEGKDRGKKISYGVPIAKSAGQVSTLPAKPAAATPVPVSVTKPAPPQPAAQLSIFNQPDQTIEAPDWLSKLGIGNELPPEPVEAEPEPTSLSLSWLESLAFDSGSALPEFDLSSLGKELTPAVTASSPAESNPGNWLESLAQNQDDIVPSTPAASNPVNWLESLAQEQGIQDAPSPAASEAVDPGNWLESLAKRQGARSKELTTKSDLNLPPIVTPSSATPRFTCVGLMMILLIIVGILIIVPALNRPTEVIFTPVSSATQTEQPTDTPVVIPTTIIPTVVLPTREIPMIITHNTDWKPVEQDFRGVIMVTVPAGCFDMGNDLANIDDIELRVGRGGHTCFDKPFWLDKTEVTNAQFAQFGGNTKWPSQWTEADRPRETITWFEARDFCIRRKARLPTEAEWEYAARGPDNLIYPWGNKFVANNTVYNPNSNQHTAAVGSKLSGKSWVGALDMSGNVWEWVLTLSLSYPYPTPGGSAELQQWIDNFSQTSVHVMRGGSWYDSEAPYLSSIYRLSRYPGPDSSYDYGFRCAVSDTP